MDTSQAKPTIEQIEKWDKNELLGWIHKKLPGLLTGDDLEKFETASIRGRTFVRHAGDVEFFQKMLPYGISDELANLAMEIVGRETAGMKSKLLSFTPCTPRRQQANNITGNRQQAEDVELSFSQSCKSLASSIC
jgi:hypothetical protein